MEQLRGRASVVSPDQPCRSSGTSTRGHVDQPISQELENAKHSAAFFKSPTYLQNADDSGFAEMCPHEADDTEIRHARKDFLFPVQHRPSSTACSTPYRDSMTEPNCDHFGTPCSDASLISPEPQQSSFLRMNESGTSKLHPVFDHHNLHRNIDNLSRNSNIPAPILISFSPSQCRPLWRDSAPLRSVSSLSSGHSTLASMLNSLPLNVAARGMDTKESENQAPVSTRQFESSQSIPIDAHTGKSLNSSEYTEEGQKRLRQSEFNDVFGPENGSNVIPYYDYQYSLLRGDIDKNNNFGSKISKYSDISDASANDESSQSDTSSLDESTDEEKERNQTQEIKFDLKDSRIFDRKAPENKIKTRRKALNPRRSAVKEDPRFKGVTVWLQTSFKKGESRLEISAFYSNVKVGMFRKKSASGSSECSTPRCCYFSDAEGSCPLYTLKETRVAVKTCASCRTRRTPLWRDAEDGTPLCNACGIRYKKYRLRCSKCWHIPKKEVKTYPNCPVCSASLKFSFHKKAW